MIEYLSTKQIASRLGVSRSLVRRIIKKAKPPEKKDEKDNYTFEYFTIVEFIQRQA